MSTDFATSNDPAMQAVLSHVAPVHKNRTHPSPLRLPADRKGFAPPMIEVNGLPPGMLTD